MAYISKKTTVNGVKPIGSNLFGTCSTASATAQKDVTMADFDVLVSGVTIHVYFTHKNTASSPTLKVGSTSAVAIKCNGASDGVWEDGAVISFTYNGSAWVQNDAIGSGGVTYSISASGDTVTLTGSDGSTSSATVADNDTTYGISISGNTLSLVEGGSGTQVTLPNDNTTYTISVSGHTLTLTPSNGTAQTVTLPDNDTTYELERNLLTVTHSLYVDLDGIGYDPSEDNYVTSNDGYEYLAHGTANTVYIVDASGNDISNISNVNLANVPYADYYSFGQALHDYFATHNAYRLKINDELTQSIRNVSSRIQEGAIPPYDIHEAQAWYQDADIFEVVAIGVVVGSHDTIDLVGSDNTTTSVSLKAIDIGALPASKWHVNDRNHDGYVQGTGGLYPNSAWATNSNGDPSWRRIVDMFYPVGSYYETSDASFNPNTAWGGTWSLKSSKEAYIVDEGTSGIWTYRKWSDGTAECWGRDIKTLTGTSATAPWQGYMFNVGTINYPSNLFTKVPTVTVNGAVASEYCVVSYAKGYLRLVSVALTSNRSGSQECTTNIHAIGKWSNTSDTYYRWHRTA